MKLKKSAAFKVLTGSLLMIAISVTSCKKEIETTPNSETPREIETWKTLEDYPSDITLDNWEEFVYAPDDVIAHFVEKERLESCASAKSNSLSGETISKPSMAITGLVRFYQGNIEAPTLVQFPNVTVSNCLHSMLTNNLQGPINYILFNSCSTDPSICMAVDQAVPSPMNWCDFTQQYAGATALDLVLIQKHILGIEVFTEPAQYIAADVNRDGNITGVDIIQIRKLLLDYISEWQVSDNYLFVPDALYNNFTTLNNLYNSDSYPNGINPCQPESQNNRIGVKTGDVNGSLANCF